MKMVSSLLLAAVLAVGTLGEDLRLDKNGMGATFFGIGGLSGGGATSRLLVDYKEPERTHILDYLFKPNFGASLQVLKVEIGGDSQSTDGTESSHMHTKDKVDLTTGYEWWLMKEAKARNPEIRLYGLPWAFPGWVGDDPKTGKPSGSPFTYPNQTSEYIVEWVKGAKSEHNLHIDYIGIWNERSSSAQYAQSLRAALDEAGLGTTRLVAKDGGADICDDLTKDPSYAKVIDIIGLHYPSDFNNYDTCHKLAKPLWASEESSSYDDLNGAACWGRVINSHYVLSGMTSSIMWNLVGAYYHGTNWYGSSMLTAVQPWSGYYENMGPVWATAHTTQFTKIGWRYLGKGSGSGELPQGGYYTTIADPAGKDFTLQVVKISREHAPCTRPGLPSFSVAEETVTFELAESMGAVETLEVWRSNFEMEKAILFERQEAIAVSGRRFSLRVMVGDYYTISTVRTATRGSYPVPPSQPRFPLPYSDDFEAKPASQEAPYFADQIGVLEVHPESGNPSNKVMRQMVPEDPIAWSSSPRGPVSLIGMKEWVDITIQVDFKIPSALAAGCVATRVDQSWDNGVVFCVAGTGVWNVTYAGPLRTSSQKLVATGTVGELAVGQWHTINLTTVDEQAWGRVNGKAAFAGLGIRNADAGFGAVGSNGWYAVEFDNFRVGEAGERWGPAPSCAAKEGAVVKVANCTPNGIAAEASAFDLLPSWQMRHRASGLCVEAAKAEEGAGVTLQPCNFTEPLQKFTNDYTTIRNYDRSLTLHGTSLKLAGSVGGAVTVTAKNPGWNTWGYFPNTFQLRNSEEPKLNIGVPKCLAAC